MLNIDVEIERISNGFIITNNDSSREKTYYPTLSDFISSMFDEDIKRMDKDFRECYSDGVKMVFKALCHENSSKNNDTDNVKTGWPDYYGQDLNVDE